MISQTPCPPSVAALAAALLDAPPSERPVLSPLERAWLRPWFPALAV